MNETAPLLVARGITKVVRDGTKHTTILSDVSLEVVAGERVGLVGPSGSGKSTLLHILGALDPDYSGSVTIGGQSLDGMSDGALAEFRNRSVGFVFQSYNLLGHLSVLQNIMLPARFGDAAADAGRAEQLLLRVGLGNVAHRMPRTLSGGERQRVAIARALFQHPKLVMCDEPTGNLDQVTAKEIVRLFDQLQADGVALLIATHDEAIAASTDRVLQLRGGNLLGRTPQD